MRLAFGPWEPDSAALDMRDPNSRVIMAEARGVYPAKTGYLPVPALSEFASFVLPATCVGAFVGHDSSGGHVFFAGTRTKLYKFDTVSGWVDYTRTVGGNYNVPADEYWVFTQFGSQVIAVNANDAPQVIDIDTGATHFSALGGSPPASRYVAVVGDFVVLACQLTNPRRIINSAINDATGWTVGTNLCDQQDFPDGEWITGLAGGEYGWVVQEHSIRRMIFQPGFDQAFRFERVERERGAAAGFSLIAVKDRIFFLSDDGFYSFGADGISPIGHQRVNTWFGDNSDGGRFFSVLGFSDPFAPRIYWAFFNSSGSTSLDRVLCYDWALDQWSYLTQAAQFWARTVTSSITLEGLDTYGTMETLAFSLDSRVWAGGQPVIAAITTAGKLAFLSGATPQDALLLTSPMQLTPSGRSFVRSVEPLGIFNGATLAIRAGRRERTQDSVSYSSSISPSSRTGICRVRRSGRIHVMEETLTQSSGVVWAHTEGLDVDVVPDGLQ